MRVKTRCFKQVCARSSASAEQAEGNTTLKLAGKGRFVKCSVTRASLSQTSGPPKDDEAEKALAKILELGQGDIESGNFLDINEFLAELDSEQSNERT